MEAATNPNKTKYFPDCLRLQIYKTILLIITNFGEESSGFADGRCNLMTVLVGS